MDGSAIGAAAPAKCTPTLELEQQAEHAQPAAIHGFRDYYRVLASHGHFRLLWAAEMVGCIGR